MKLALMYDCCVQDSFYIKDKVAYTFKDNKPYTHIHAISPELQVMAWNYPYLWGDGCFINVKEWTEKGLDLPDYDLDVIMYANERVGVDSKNLHKYNVERIKKKYPNAKIIGWIKEVNSSTHNMYERIHNKIEFYKDCDFFAGNGITEMKKLKQYEELEKLVGKKLNFITCPININSFFDNFYSNEKKEMIYAYTPNSINRRSDTLDFATEMGRKYNVNVISKDSEKTKNNFYHLSQKEFIELWSQASFHFNLDSTITQPGHQATQVANVGSINIGGMNESHHILFPDTATCDKKILEEKFEMYLKDLNKRGKALEFAWEKLNQTYSYDVVKKQLNNLIYGES